MKRTLATIALGLGLAVTGAVSASAQTAPPGVASINTTGNCVTTGSPGNWTISCGDINYSPGNAVMVAPTVNTSNAAGSDGTTSRPAPAPDTTASDPAPSTMDASADSSTSTGTVATAEDRDGDNYPDALEAEAGLDPTNPDTDGDGVADGDEMNLYSTGPLNWDTDGDGISDGEELFGIKTDPLVNNDGSAAPASTTAPATETLSTSAPSATEPTTSDVVATDTDNDGVADADEVNIYGTDPNLADSDGDGLTDGNELFATSTDPLVWDTDGDGAADGQSATTA
ncbi:MAG: hypothetical protein QM692_20825 [Thermomicrobiales bacterium]